MVPVPAAATAVAGGRQPSVVSTAATRPTLRYGSRGPHVVHLQQRLTALRYDVGPVDGSFGSSTLHGVYAFQKVQGIGVDGVVGPITWGRLASPYVPRARYNRAAACVEVNLTRRVVYLTRSGAVTRILDASPASRPRRRRPGASRSSGGSMSGARARWGCCGGPTTSTAALPCTGRPRCRPLRPATAVSG
jgi:hypothetical protein